MPIAKHFDYEVLHDTNFWESKVSVLVYTITLSLCLDWLYIFIFTAERDCEPRLARYVDPPSGYPLTLKNSRAYEEIITTDNL